MTALPSGAGSRHGVGAVSDRWAFGSRNGGVPEGWGDELDAFRLPGAGG